MKTKKLFLLLVMFQFGEFVTSNAQTTETTNAVSAGSYLGTSTNIPVEFKFNGVYAGLITHQNTFYGVSAGTTESNSGNYEFNSAFGEEALSAFNAANSIKYNSAFGARALQNNLSTGNSAFGGLALQNNTTGYFNTALGHQALLSNTSGYNNIAIGYRAMEKNTTGKGNIGLGSDALKWLDGGTNNIGIGNSSLWGLIGNNNKDNLALGTLAGRYLTQGSDNVLIGSRINFHTGPSTSIRAGNDTSNTLVLGSNGDQRIFIHSNGYTGVGLGNNVIPQNILELGNGISGTSGLRFRNYTSASPTVAPNGFVLTLNTDGDVVLTTDQGTGGSTLINAGTNINVTGNGSAATPFVISSTASNDNIYTTDGTLAGNRIVTMNNNRLMFDTDNSGAIYIGDRNDIANNNNFPMMNDSYRLFVEGGILTEKVKVALRSTANWADFVFENDYKLPSLREVEAFIKKNKHLPGIESADELVENGLDLADMQAKQMQKIEELTLYTIEQDKVLKRQSDEIEILKAQVKAILERQ
ncbi:hypothetical protein DFQ10_10961 [Winogradskyella eximia]|uniref:TMF family protein n=1 Tax=Winogradskyella eximia TaxID=262006 RepID=A0A3D9GYY6_9FLAO|nr:hypothetical protein [Winogradskyella eximia]RED42166.1 hypothetical protein DFQ10_10961 [Winogradskyella eximia]